MCWSAGAVLPHFGEVAFPSHTSEEMAKTLDLLDSKGFREGQIDCGGVCLDAEDPGGFLEEITIKHKICTPHVYIIHNDTDGVQVKELVRRGAPFAEDQILSGST
jgi:hypothetical protein